MKFPDKVYDVTKFIALVFLPALGTLYFGLAPLWDLPNADKVVGTIVVIDAFLGAVVGFSARAYNADENNFDGVVHTLVNDEGRQFLLEVPDPEVVADKNTVTLKVDNH